MRDLYTAGLRSVVIAAMLATLVQVAMQTQTPRWVEDTYEFGPSDCNQTPSTGRMRFNVCANLDISRMSIR